ncbi:hypothetical protein GDO81_026980 [Engystomops pustulosus]|uniref:Platelet-derived growth factor (PDGF) family profile domain-containing protein n=1 Tax=Engystomops pustulosus TaxID=76066 RepID=A0AAV6ZIB2_ENGPU|nr:hypothetical protein GDO81_026980 [Engystomops pustulosus]
MAVCCIIPDPRAAGITRTSPKSNKTSAPKAIEEQTEAGCRFSRAAPTHEKERKHTEVVPFINVYERSMCKVRETLVDIYQEYPDEVEYIFKPSCLPLMRCAGCCSDENFECVPTEWYNVTMQILRMKPHMSQLYVEKTFQQHSRCECRQKKEIKGKQEK